MAETEQVASDRFVPGSSDEAGTAPGDRKFRPDVEGLRAVAIVLVVLFHAGLSGVSGGYVGVDVFFVISGFVITGVLLRERGSSGRTSMLAFYGRRARRIIPAATLAIVVTVVLTYAVLGVISGDQTAIDGRWAAFFLANVHFAAEGTNYLSARQPPSPLQNFWSLAVEEQFYFVYPTVFVAIAAVPTRLSLRVKLALGLIAVTAVSFAWSVVQTGTNPTSAYFSPFTRAWELAVGALVAVATEWLLRLPPRIGAVLSWVGLAAICWSAFVFTSASAYPGSLVAVPVLGAALVIAGGVPAPTWGAEALLRLAPFGWMGRISYSLYLWHWPILVLAAEAAGRTSLPFTTNVPWLGVALGASVVSYYAIERPIRHARLFATGRRWAPLALGVVLVVASFGMVTAQLDAHGSGPSTGTSTAVRSTSGTATGTLGVSNSAALAAVLDAVHQAASIRTVPADLSPPLGSVRSDWGGPPGSCWPSLGQSSIPACVFGDVQGSRTMVVYGDSHAGMWFDTLDLIASLSHWKLVYLGKGDCPVDMLPYGDPIGWGRPGRVYAPCQQWHRFAIDRINQLRPDLVVITQELRSKPNGRSYSWAQWQLGLEAAVHMLDVPPSHVDVLGNIPILPHDGAQCLATHTNDVQKCSSPLPAYVAADNAAERTAAAAVGARYISTVPWFCSTTCTAIVGRYEVYWDRWHVTAAYAQFLDRVLADALNLNSVT